MQIFTIEVSLNFQWIGRIDKLIDGNFRFICKKLSPSVWNIGWFAALNASMRCGIHRRRIYRVQHSDCLRRSSSMAAQAFAFQLANERRVWRLAESSQSEKLKHEKYMGKKWGNLFANFFPRHLCSRCIWYSNFLPFLKKKKTIFRSNSFFFKKVDYPFV